MKLSAPASSWDSALSVLQSHAQSSANGRIRFGASSDVPTATAKSDGILLQQELDGFAASEESGEGPCWVGVSSLKDTAKNLKKGGERMTLACTEKQSEGTSEAIAKVTSSGGFEAEWSPEVGEEFSSASLPDRPAETWRPKRLKAALERVLHATAAPSEDAELASVYFDLADGRLVATDKAVLSYVEVDSDSEWQGLVPAAACEALVEALPDGAAARLWYGEDKLYASWDGGALEAPLRRGQFPNYKSALRRRDQFEARREVAREALEGAIQRTSLYGPDDPRRVQMQAGLNGHVCLEGTDPHRSTEAIERVRVQDREGEGAEVTCNPRLLAETLSRYDADTVMLRLRGPTQGFDVEPVGDGPARRTMMMPIDPDAYA